VAVAARRAAYSARSAVCSTGTITDALVAPSFDEPTPDPIARFAALLEEARRVGGDQLPEPTAFALASVGIDGRPSVRMVLLKGAGDDGFVFYTNLGSRKGRELLARPSAAMCFHWQMLDRQVRVEGPVERVSDEEADAYFATRPRGSQLGAWASRQSEPMGEPDELDRRLAEFDARFAGGPVPRPPYWSGFRLLPSSVEFWIGQPNRLHIRHLYSRDGDGWRIETLYP
jgi:pyridoxamine 5'-phosphate oxidase